MFPTKLFLVTVPLVSVNSEVIHVDFGPYQVEKDFITRNYDLDQTLEYKHPRELDNVRVRRQAKGSLSLNGDGSAGLRAKVPLIGNNKTVLSAIGKVDFDNQMHTASKGFGLALDNVNKVGASLGMANTPFLGRKDYSTMGNLNVFHSPTSTVDFSAGFKSFDTPVMSSGWKPNFMLNFGRSF